MSSAILATSDEPPVVRYAEVFDDHGTRMIRVVLSMRNLAPHVDIIEFVASFNDIREWLGALGLELGRVESDFLADIEAGRVSQSPEVTA